MDKMRFYLISICLIFGACSTLPPAFENRDIQDLTYAQVSADVENYQNVRVKWGGIVEEVRKVNDDSMMQVQLHPLDHYGRPEIDKPGEGLFVVKSAEKLDPETYFTSREIVVVGVIAGKAQSLAQPGQTGLPLIKADAIHPWPIAYRENYYRYCPSCYFRQLFW